MPRLVLGDNSDAVGTSASGTKGTNQLNTSVRRAAGVVVCALALTASAGCTGGSKTPAARPTPAASSASTGSVATMTPRPVPLKVLVTRVSGRLPAKARTSLQGNVGRTISAYVDGAFLGDYPRSDFSAAFATFTKGAASDAKRDRDLLTNARFGPSTGSVAVKKQTAYLSVLAPHKVAAGVTARVELALLLDRADKSAERVHVTGRLLLTRKQGGGWQIFGYDLARSNTAVGGGS
jgi:hypothetical protein